MARAYRYARDAESAPKPPEIEAGQLVDRFGAQAVYGRLMTREEMHAIMTAETIVNAYKQREATEDIAGWANEHPGLQKLLIAAMRAADGERG